jgi:hypothetical protein
MNSMPYKIVWVRNASLFFKTFQKGAQTGTSEALNHGG